MTSSFDLLETWILSSYPAVLELESQNPKELLKEHMEATAEKHIREIYSEKELEQMDSIEEAAPQLVSGSTCWVKIP